MKKFYSIATIMVASFLASACDDSEKINPPTDVEVVDTTDNDECPRADGEPCR